MSVDCIVSMQTCTGGGVGGGGLVGLRPQISSRCITLQVVPPILSRCSLYIFTARKSFQDCNGYRTKNDGIS